MFFDINNFLLGFSLDYISLTIICSIVIIGVYCKFGGVTNETLYNLFLIGGTFFIAQSIERAAKDDPRWERTVANLILWIIFVGGIGLFREIFNKFRPKI